MHYENRQPPEGINVVAQGWQRDFVLLVAGFFAAFILLCWLLLQVVAWTAKWTPFSWEKAATGNWFTATQVTDDKTVFLRQLAGALAVAGGLAPDLAVRVHSSPQPIANAFATLGGNIIVLDGILDTLNSEQGLAFVLAHEIAHIHHRDPVRAVARGLSISVVTSLVFGQSDLSQLAGLGGNLVLLQYSRQQEAEADAWALQAVFRHYGHVAGVDELFQALLKEGESSTELPEWLGSHPDLQRRIQTLRDLALNKGYALEGEIIPLPKFPTGPQGSGE